MQIDDRLRGALAVTALRADRSPGLIQFLPGGAVRAVPARRTLRVKLENTEMEAWFATAGELQWPLWFGEMRRVDDSEILDAMTEMRMEPKIMLISACGILMLALTMLSVPGAFSEFGVGLSLLMRLLVSVAGAGVAWASVRIVRRRVRRSAEYDLRVEGLRMSWGG